MLNGWRCPTAVAAGGTATLRLPAWGGWRPRSLLSGKGRLWTIAPPRCGVGNTKHARGRSGASSAGAKGSGRGAERSHSQKKSARRRFPCQEKTPSVYGLPALLQAFPGLGLPLAGRRLLLASGDHQEDRQEQAAQEFRRRDALHQDSSLPVRFPAGDDFLSSFRMPGIQRYTGPKVRATSPFRGTRKMKHFF